MLNTCIYIGIGAGCTLFLRALPFILMNGKKEIPKPVKYLGSALPPAIMAVLIIYCIQDVPVAPVQSGIPKAAGILVTAGSYIWKKNQVMSICLGTICYMLLLYLL